MKSLERAAMYDEVMSNVMLECTNASKQLDLGVENSGSDN
jgi:hypothetical protein